MSVEEIIRNKHAEDNEQLEFIFSDEPKIIVTAPAGCGKTTAMVSKIARELCSGSIVSNKKVLAMTFSVNAALRIKDSLNELLPDIVDDPKDLLNKVDIANYHNFAMKLLHKYGYALNNNFINLDSFRIIDDEAVISQGLLTSSDEFEFKKLADAVLSFQYDELCRCLDPYWNILSDKLINHNIITYNGILVAAINLFRKSNVANFGASVAWVGK